MLPPYLRKVDNWAELEEDFHRVKSWEGLSTRLVTRALSMAKMLMDIFGVLKKAGAAFFHSQRKADQCATLMTGA